MSLKIFLLYSISIICFHAKAQLDSCSYTVLDLDFKFKINKVEVFTKNGQINSTNGSFIYYGNINDSLLIKSTGYEDKIVVFNKVKDSIFLIKNSFGFEEIVIQSNGKIKKNQFLKFGKKNRQNDLGLILNRKDIEVFTTYKSPFEKKVKVYEASLYIFNNPDTCLNLTVEFYEIENGKKGKLIYRNTTFENSKKRGWCNMELSENFKIPKEGFMVSVKNLNDNSVTIGSLSYSNENQIESYWIDPNDKIRKIDYKGYNCGIKLLLKVK